jgi:hypothetical protein
MCGCRRSAGEIPRRAASTAAAGEKMRFVHDVNQPYQVGGKRIGVNRTNLFAVSNDFAELALFEALLDHAKLHLEAEQSIKSSTAKRK